MVGSNSKIKIMRSALQPLRRKILAERALGFLLTGIFVCLLCCIVLLAAAKFILITGIGIKITTIFATVLFVVILISILNVPTLYSVAEACDKLGFKQRFVTALELLETNKDSYITELVVFDALESAANNNIPKMYKFKIDIKKIYLIALMSAMVSAAYFIPSPRAEALKSELLFKEKIDNEIKKINESAKEVYKEITIKDADEMQVRIKELTKSLMSASSEAQAIKILQKTQEEFKKISKSSLSKDLRALGDTLAQYELTKAVGESLQKADVEAIRANMEELSEALKNASADDLKKLSEYLIEAEKEIANNPELAEAINQLSQMINSGKLGDLRNQISELTNNFEKLGKQNQNLRRAAEKLNNTIAQSSADISPKSETAQGNNGVQGEKNNQLQMQEINSANERQNGVGEGNGRGTGHVNNENIYSRKTAELKESEFKIESVENDTGVVSWQEQEGLGHIGDYIPYEAVLSEYRDEALHSLDNSQIPYGLKELVKEYFSSL